MPRKPRIEYADACYHVLNRGNYRSYIFSVSGAAEAFERVLFEACERFGWHLYAYVLLSNHYHLCFRTVDANLVVGMQWLQSTFANRFNRFVNERGHVFQGRYQSLLIENDASLLRVVNYIHLNPVRAGLTSVDDLKSFSHSSFPKLFHRKRLTCLHAEGWLREAGNLKFTASGLKCYHKSLALADEADPNRRDALYRDLCRGWYIGTKVGKKAILKDLSEGLISAEKDYQAYGESYAESLLEEGLKRLEKTTTDLERDLKLAHWKVVLAAWIKVQSSVGNRWFSTELCMGNIYSLSKEISAELSSKRRDKVWKKLGTPKPKA